VIQYLIARIEDKIITIGGMVINKI